MAGRARKDLDRAFGVVLRSARLKAGLSQEALAHRCDRHPTFISLLERGQNSPSLSTIAVIANALSMRPYELVRAAEDRLP